MGETDRNSVIAECESFAGKMPPFNAAIAMCMVAQIIVFYGKAPVALSLVAPLLIIAVTAWRMIWWMVRRRKPFDEAQARAALNRTKTLLYVSTAGIIGLDIMLFQYADDLGRAFLMFELLGAATIGIYCMMHIRTTAYFMAGALAAAMVFTFHAFPAEIAAGVAIVVISVSCMMLVAMRGYHGDFVRLIRTTEAARALSAENSRLANIDMLTDLPNRRQFFVDVAAACEKARAQGLRVAVAIADLDGFKPINDTHGHVTGDHVLKVVAGRIAGEAPLHAYRLGGDEFAFIMSGAESDSALLAAGDAAIARIGEPIGLSELIVSTGCSIGISTFPDMAATPELLYERADYALYHAKRTGRNKTLIFTREHESQLRAQGEIEQALRTADFEREFYLVYQPIVRPSDGVALGFECLARWRCPSLGDVPPSAFIPVAEHSGLIATLTPYLLRKALTQAAAWPEDVRISFNLSAHDIASRERTLLIIGIIGSSGVSPRRIDLELTETAVLHNFEQVCENMRMLKGIGVNISLDDFGTGYSSLSHVHVLPLDKIKIDRSFIQNLETSRSGRMIVGSIMSLCRDLELACVVEGVETDEQLRVLSELGCDQVQGYLFSRPIAVEDADAWLAERRPFVAGEADLVKGRRTQGALAQPGPLAGGQEADLRSLAAMHGPTAALR